MTGVSRLPSRPRSPMTLAMTPEEEIQVTPARTTAATGPQPMQQGGHRGAGHGVQGEVDQTGRVLGLEVGDEVAGGVLQAEHQQQQDDADLGADRDELLAGAQRQQAALTEGEPGQQVEGYRGELEAPGDPAEQPQAEDDRTELDQEDGGDAPASLPSEYRGGRLHTLAGADHDEGVAAGQPEVRRGRGDAPRARRSTATIEAPVSVRIRVSPSTRPFQYECADSSIRSATRPRSVVCSTFGLWWAGISASISEAVSGTVRCSDCAHASGSSAR